jgi:hypothetical protein
MLQQSVTCVTLRTNTSLAAYGAGVNRAGYHPRVPGPPLNGPAIQLFTHPP